MPDVKRIGFALLLLLSLSGCVSQRYMGVQISSTEPMSMTKVTLNGTTTILCLVGKR